MKKQKLEYALYDRFYDAYKISEGNKLQRAKAGVKDLFGLLKQYLITSNYLAKQYKTKNKVIIKNKAYYQKSININKILNHFVSAGTLLKKYFSTS